MLRIQRESAMAARLSIEKPPGMHVREGGRMEQCEILRCARWLGPDSVLGRAIIQRELASFGAYAALAMVHPRGSMSIRPITSR
jgi:hypothetical protein